ncbi:hypothetical protein E1288_06140 [Saccharopolyspora elongata]|uniref:Uncharacterized protein n=1 Tax=Saccharopolyspora elongata TaxID=2530387 RepID=A0A4R4ZC60_9PSEU|nr:hypothetical protein E1288_06140 [Saccharopolyspora elongata]
MAGLLVAVISAAVAVAQLVEPSSPAEHVQECQHKYAAPYVRGREVAPGVVEKKFGSCSWPPVPGTGADGFSDVTVTEYAIPDVPMASKFTNAQQIESECTRLSLRYRFYSQGTVAQAPLDVDNDQIVSFYDGSPEAIPAELEGIIRDPRGPEEPGPKSLIVLSHDRYELVQAECVDPH